MDHRTASQLKEIADGIGKRMDRLETKQTELRGLSGLDSGPRSRQAKDIEALGYYAIDRVRMAAGMEPIHSKDYDTETASPGAGQLLPQLLVSTVDFFARSGGAFLAGVNKVTGQPGQVVRIPGVNEGSAAWRIAENSSISTSEPVTAEIQRKPVLLGALALMSLEAQEYSGASGGSVASVIGNELSRAIAYGSESALFHGTADAGPRAGILEDANVPETVAPVAGWTIADLLAFLTEAEASYPGMFSGLTGGTGGLEAPVLVMTPAGWFSILNEAATTASGRMVINSETMAFAGLRVVLSPHCRTAEGPYVVACRMRDVHFVGTNQIRIDLDPFSKFDQASTQLRVCTWADYGWTFPTRLFRGPVGFSPA